MMRYFEFSPLVACLIVITGFTAWSSERGPEQVFTLLETIYGCMDKVAKKHGVFKVETIGGNEISVTVRKQM